ncbi:alpha/beta fold hydrolase [Clostridium tertium]|jgi:dienelactone hydrolase|uniref:alpha/beta fold hydrolase n=2 Tax=Clostridium tertium TaxID=1559 RepID=UPI002027F1B4|nr:alpha/beta fold hydrolase [Clostridium tertium]MDB1922570.1 alpha/beta fold hydrolase [Clostridium tertium]MDB1926401.1 alpha/beta fold hydrolase [Clostridium tertium]MDB1928927.1 alpha/beta fold hydrolase [Clostridium tertium]MDB1940757.1 alpha/beta fold hydrolase [Clostridium tertium]MDY4605223.1 alpha/beta fold hydrolase [Clostridium tertium]
MKLNKKTKYILNIILSIIILTFLGFIIWTSNTYKPLNELFNTISVDEYSKEEGFYVFYPKQNNKNVGIVLYPGALVEPLSYSYYANELSKEGYLVAIANVNFNLSILDNNKASKFIKMKTDIEKWYVGGHSMGGVSAAMFAENNQDIVKGVIFLASYPASSSDLSDNDIEVLSIYAENDGLTTIDNIEESKENLPTEAVFKEIDGGNHAQFGVYGYQSGDNEPEISWEEQQKEMIKITLEFLKK